MCRDLFSQVRLFSRESQIIFWEDSLSLNLQRHKHKLKDFSSGCRFVTVVWGRRSWAVSQFSFAPVWVACGTEVMQPGPPLTVGWLVACYPRWQTPECWCVPLSKRGNLPGAEPGLGWGKRGTRGAKQLLLLRTVWVLETPIVLELHSAGRQYIGRCWKEATGFSSAKVSADRLCAGYCGKNRFLGPGPSSQGLPTQDDGWHRQW